MIYAPEIHTRSNQVTQIASSQPRELSIRAAAERAGLTQHRFLKMIAVGRIKPLLRPGELPRILSKDAERLRAELAGEVATDPPHE
jgi:hypothetical protein